MKKPLILGSIAVLATGFGWSAALSSSQAEVIQLAQVPAAEAATSPESSEIEIIDLGAEPRQVVQFQVPENAQQTVIMTMDTSFTMSVGGQAAPMVDSPAVQMAIEITSGEADAEGSTPIQFVYSNVEVLANATTAPEVVEMLQAQLQSLTEVRGSYTVTRDGAIEDIDLATPEDVPPSMAQMLEQMMSSFTQFALPPLPTTALGEGAKWQVSTEIPTPYLTMQGSIAYELVEIQEESVVLNTTTDFSSEPQVLDSESFPGLPPDAIVELTALSAQSNGSVTLAFDQLMPMYSTSVGNSDMSYDLTLPENQQTIPVIVQSQVNLTLESN